MQATLRPAGFKETFSRGVKVHFVGVWDTASPVGVMRHKVLPDTANGMGLVYYFRHALAPDERRVTFLPAYAYQGLSGSEKTKDRAPQNGSSRIKEVLFVGAHSDVGGSIHRIKHRQAAALRWMLYEASSRGLQLDDWSVEQEPATEIHESLQSYRPQHRTRRRPHLGTACCAKDGQTFHSTVLASLENGYIPKATISWKPHQSGACWVRLRNSGDEQAQRIERDLNDVALDAIRAYEQQVQKLQGGQGVSGHEVLGDVTRCSQTEEGRRTLRENNAADALVKSATNVLDKLRPEHLDALLDITIRIGTGTRTVSINRDCLRLTRMLSERPQWPEFRDLFPIERDVFVISGHTHQVMSVSASHDGTRIASDSDGKTLRIWDASTGTPVGSPLEGHNGAVWSVAFSPDDTHIVSGSLDHTIRVWIWRRGPPLLGSPLIRHSNYVWSVVFSPDGTHIVSGSLDDTILIWDVEAGTIVVGPIAGHTTSVYSVAYSPDGSRIVSGSFDRTIRIWHAKTGKAIGKPLKGHGGRVWSVAFSPDSKCVISGSDDGTVRIWDVEDLVV
ncbi:hypothetical protein CERSUDRAFT_107810 [Gelatoporia subvermispora B]|uniref:T6SS Phospholipase effector Tle1-like catalytic domain-containing protein n=1 Tax=Ceriporiopsis subvermispora (strain B) TaxID=914234 RepID=M2QAR6_CERS8|nr:hypothetical protein CERSUDRAFT_107810 [Gelatoporia subvermispora B]